MESMFLLIPLVAVFAIVAVLIFTWAVNNGQYDDLDREAEQVLFDQDKVLPSTPNAGANPRVRPGQTHGSAPANTDNDEHD
jgi:cbb3-type cytochrome oxidase maturation protein